MPFPLLSHPTGVARARGVVRHVLGSAAVAVREGAHPSVRGRPGEGMQASQQRARWCPRKLLTLRGTPSKEKPPSSIHLGPGRLHWPFFMPVFTEVTGRIR